MNKHKKIERYPNTPEDQVLQQIWGVFNDANKEHEPMLCGDDEKKIHVFLKAYSRSNES